VNITKILSRTGFRIEGHEFGISQCVLENVIVEYSTVYGIYMDCATWHTRSNIFKRIWLEGNTDFAFYYKNGDAGTLDEIYADPGTNQTVYIENGEHLNIRNVQGNLTIVNDKECYIDGYITGTEIYSYPNKVIRLNKDNYKKYISTNTGAVLGNAWNYITGQKTGTAQGVFMVTVKDTTNDDFCVSIYTFKDGSYCTKTVLAGALAITENTSGTVAPINGHPVVITVDMLSNKY
jgi:hypothetical protein